MQPRRNAIRRTARAAVAKEDEKVGSFIFGGDIARAGESGYAFVRQFTTGPNGPMGDLQWNGPHLPLKKFA